MDVEAFARGYVQATVWMAWYEDEEGLPALESETFAELTGVSFTQDGQEWADAVTELLPGLPAALLPDAVAFVDENQDLLEEACERPGYDAEQAGADFYFSRAGHGVGYWDRELGAIGDQLHEATKPYGDVTVMLWHDHKGALNFDVV